MTCTFQGKRAIVTGGASGIGRAIVELFVDPTDVHEQVVFRGRV